jgi:hypothetical protein
MNVNESITKTFQNPIQANIAAIEREKAYVNHAATFV